LMRLPTMAIDKFALVHDAIRHKRQVAATYKGHKRWMCPHVLGYKEGVRHCVFYQFGGSSNHGLAWDGSPSNWRCIPVEELEDVQSVVGPWHSARNYSPDEQTCVDEIVASV